MAQQDSIIDHRNISGLYFGWVFSLVSVIAISVLAYVLQFTTPFIIEKATLPIYICAGVGVVLAVLAIMFKFVFKREIVAWVFSICIAIIGLGLFLVYGWHWGFTVFIIVAFTWLLALGPYLYFD